MRRLLLILAALALIAATPDEVITDLEASEFDVEDGSGASPNWVSRRADPLDRSGSVSS